MIDLNALADDQLSTLIEDARAELHARIEERRESVMDKIRELANSIGVSVTFAGESIPAQRIREARNNGNRAPVPILYRDGSNTWTGRGRTPKWLQAHIDNGMSKDDFRLAP